MTRKLKFFTILSMLLLLTACSEDEVKEPVKEVKEIKTDVESLNKLNDEIKDTIVEDVTKQTTEPETSDATVKLVERYLELDKETKQIFAEGDSKELGENIALIGDTFEKLTNLNIEFEKHKENEFIRSDVSEYLDGGFTLTYSLLEELEKYYFYTNQDDFIENIEILIFSNKSNIENLNDYLANKLEE